MMEVKYTTQRLDHLGIVAGICDEIGLVGQIDRLVPAPRRQVSVGQAVKAIILNAFGIEHRFVHLDFSSFQPSNSLSWACTARKSFRSKPERGSRLA